MQKSGRLITYLLLAICVAIPFATFIIMNMIGNDRINKAREAYTAEVLEMKL